MIVGKARFLHIGFSFSAGVNVHDVAQTMESDPMFGDWLQYAPNCYLVWSADAPATLRERLLKLPHMSESFMLICEINIDSADGWLPEGAWAWLRRPRVPHLPIR